MRIERTIAFDEPGFKSPLHHKRTFIESAARLIHFDTTEMAILTLGEPAAHAEAQATPGHVVEHGNLFSDTQRLVPRHDDCGRSDVDAGGTPSNVRQPLGVVGAEGVVVKVVFDRPHAIESKVLGEQCKLGFFVVDLPIGDCVPAVTREQRLRPNVHGSNLQ